MTHSDIFPAKIEPGVSIGQVLPSLVFDLALPVVTYFVLTGFGVAKLLALCAGGLFPALNIARTWIGSRRIQPLGVIVITFIAIGTAAALVSGSVFVALVKDFLLAGTFGLLCLGSLFARPRPLMFYLLRQFIAGEDVARLEWWETQWQRAPFRAAMRRVTTIWGIGYVLQAAIGVTCAWWLQPAQVVIISPVIAGAVLAALAAWTRWYLLTLREALRAGCSRPLRGLVSPFGETLH
jgi:hypothetical protein